jgi:hypothetical protein
MKIVIKVEQPNRRKGEDKYMAEWTVRDTHIVDVKGEEYSKTVKQLLALVNESILAALPSLTL